MSKFIEVKEITLESEQEYNRVNYPSDKETIIKQINEMISDYRDLKQYALKKNDSIGITLNQKLISEFSSLRNIIYSLPDPAKEKHLKLFNWHKIEGKDDYGNTQIILMQVVFIYSDFTVECELIPYTEELWETWVLLMKEVGSSLPITMLYAGGGWFNEI